MAAEEFESPSFGNFSIQDTMEMGMGNAELLNDLLSPETSTESPDNVQKIKDEPAKPTSPAPVAKPVDKVEDKEEKKDREEDNKNILEDFLKTSEEGDDEDEDEEIEKGNETKDESKEDDPKEEEGENNNRFTALSNDLFKLGVFTKDEGEEDVTISSPEEFLERFQNEKKKGANEVINNFIGQFGEDYQEAFQAIYVKGVDPKEYFSVYNNISNFAEMDLTKEENQVAVIRQGLKDQGFDAEDIETEIERIKNYADLEPVSAKYHKVLVKQEALKLQQLEQKAELEQQQKSSMREKYVSNVQSILQNKLKTKEFDGIPLNPKIANEVQDFLLVDKYKLPSGETLTDFDKAILEMKRPENHEMKVKVALLLKLLEKDPTLSTIQRTGVTKQSDELFSSVVRQKEKQTSSTTNKATPPSKWFSS